MPIQSIGKYNMKAIGFSNFRKFQSFPVMQLGDITIFVGGNNSGKSTTVKAIISVLSFLKNASFYSVGKSKSILENYFYFNQNPYAHIGTFKRAINNNASSNDIFFEVKIEDYIFKVYLNGDGADINTTYAKVRQIEVEDTRSLLRMIINFEQDSFSFLFRKNREHYKSIDEYIKLSNKVDEYLIKVSEGDQSAKKNVTKFKTALNSGFPIADEDCTLKTKISELGKKRIMGGPLITGMIFNALFTYFYDYDTVEENVKVLIDSFRSYLFNMCSKIEQLLILNPLVEYIYAHSASQIVLYNSNENDYLSQTVHSFAEISGDKESTARTFVKKWMKFFNIGKDYECNTIGGEAHTFEIIGFDGKRSYLADKGMGTIQLMILLLRLAIIIVNRNRTSTRAGSPITVIVEEPEQNLHPKVQSQLIDFFTAINKDYQIKFIIETHSEYLIRKSQILVHDMGYTTQEEAERNNPYRVYYFPQDDVPYQMEYRLDGKFSNKFGSGFFDEASNLAFDLF